MADEEPTGRTPAPEPPDALLAGLTGIERNRVRYAWRHGWVKGAGAGHARALRVVEETVDEWARTVAG